MIERAPEHVLAHVAPAGGRLGLVNLGLVERGLHLRHAHLHQPRMAIGPAAFIGHPMRAQVAFFEHMHRNSSGAGRCNGMGMDGPGIAIERQIGNPAFGHQGGDMGRPLLHLSTIGNIAAIRGPHRPVAPVETDAPDLGPRRLKHFAKAMEEGPMRPLQEQKAAVLSGDRHGTLIPGSARDRQRQSFLSGKV